MKRLEPKPDLYLLLEGQQAGPYPFEQVRLEIAAGNLSGETLAWHEALTDWIPLAQVMVEFPEEVVAPAPVVVQSRVVAPRPANPKRGWSRFRWPAVFLCLIGFGMMVPTTNDDSPGSASTASVMETNAPTTVTVTDTKRQAEINAKVANLERALHQYARAHHGMLPAGKSSTRIFQTLLDEQLLTEPEAVYFDLPGKIKPTKGPLVPVNVCFDLTSVVWGSPQNTDEVLSVLPSTSIPLVYSTGFVVRYVAGGKAEVSGRTYPAWSPATPLSMRGIYFGTGEDTSRFLPCSAEGVVRDFVPSDFNAIGQTCRQLTPYGMLIDLHPGQHKQGILTFEGKIMGMALFLALGLFAFTLLRADPTVPQDSASTPVKLPDTVFPKDNPWNTPVSDLAVDPRSATYLVSVGLDKPLHPDFGAGNNGIPFQIIDPDAPRIVVTFQYADESDKGPYPIPANPKIEGGPGATSGDRHLLLIDPREWMLYELWQAEKKGDGWHAGSGAIWDLKTNATRPKGWTSADAAGLPIYPGLVRYNEVKDGVIAHALRFTVQQTQKAYVAPASHWASAYHDPNLLPMGARLRLRQDFDVSGFSPEVRVILIALKTYGMILADNGSDWFISGAPDDRWNDEVLHQLSRVKGKDLEVVQMGEIVRSR